MITKIPVEQRFPLDLSVTHQDIRTMYEEAKTLRWNPERDLPWSQYDLTELSTEARAAARISWSRRLWTEHSRLSEIPAVIVRLCLEKQREADPKYFFTVQGTEQSWHIDVMLRLCELLGGFSGQPENTEYAKIFNQQGYRKALDETTHFDSYLATECACRSTIDLNVYQAILKETRHPLVRAALERMISDKERHTKFIWTYIQKRLLNWTANDYQQVGKQVHNYLSKVQLAGFQFAWLAGDGIADEVVQADAITAREGLGALSQQQEYRVFRHSFADLRRRHSDLGIEYEPISHDLLDDM